MGLPAAAQGRRRPRLKDCDGGGRLDGALPLLKPLQPAVAPGSRGRADRCQPAAGGIDRLILESLANPQHRNLTIQQRCEVTGVSRPTWYRHTSQPLFKARATTVFRRMCDDDLLPIISTLIESAKELGKEGHADRKLFLALCGIYEAGVTSARAKDEEPAKQSSTMTDAELLAHFADRPHLLPPGVQRRMGLTNSLAQTGVPSSTASKPADAMK